MWIHKFIAFSGTILTILIMAVLYLCLLSSHWSVLCGEKFYELLHFSAVKEKVVLYLNSEQ